MALGSEHVCIVGRLCMGLGGDADFSQGGGHGNSSRGSIQSSLGPAGNLYSSGSCVIISSSHWCESMYSSDGIVEEDGLINGISDF